MTSSQAAMRSGYLAVLPLLSILVFSCTPDPPDTGFLVIAVETTPFEGLEGVRVVNERVDLVVRSDPDDPSTEQVVTIGEIPTEVGFATGLGGQFPEVQAIYEVEEGYIYQIRFVNSAVFARFNEELVPVEITAPSGPQTGLKVIPVDGVPFRIKKNKKTIINVLFDPEHQLVFNPDKTLIKPVIRAELLAEEDLRVTRIINEHVIVLFSIGTNQTDIDSLNSTLGGTIVRRSHFNPLLMEIHVPGQPTSDSVAAYRAESIVEAAIHDVVSTSDETFPNDLNPDQDNLNNTGQRGGSNDADIDAPEAWDITTGDLSVAIAGIDTGVDLDHPDIIFNLWINQLELPPALFDVEPAGAPDGVVDGADLAALDTDGDTIISFRDLNNPAFALNAPGQCLGGIAPLDCDRDGDTVVTPFDIVDGDPGLLTGFEDGFNTDGNPFDDDLVGWNFSDNNNLPDDDHVRSHGTGTAGVFGARGNNLADIPANFNISGVNWDVSIIPLKIADAAARGNPLDWYDAIELAVGYGAPVASMSFTDKFFEDGVIDLNAEKDNFTAIFDASQGDQLLLANSTGNGRYNLDAADTLLLPAEIERDTIITVGSTNAKDDLVKSSGRGDTTVDVLAPGENILTLSNADIRMVTFISGTSFATPHVAGIAGLMYVVDPFLLPADARQTLIDTVDDLGLGGKTVSGGRVNARSALDAL